MVSLGYLEGVLRVPKLFGRGLKVSWVDLKGCLEGI